MFSNSKRNFTVEPVREWVFNEPLGYANRNPCLDGVIQNISQQSIDGWIKEYQTHELEISFEKLLEILELDAEFKPFVQAETKRIKAAADAIRANGSLQRTDFGTGGGYYHDSHLRFFRNYYQKICAAYDGIKPCYEIVDVDSYPILNTGISPGLAIMDQGGACYSGRDEPSTDVQGIHIPVVFDAKQSRSSISNETLAKLCSCVNAMWVMQSNRIFIPTFYVNGSHLDILVFTRNQLLRTRLGQMVPKTKRGLVKLLGALSFLVLLPVNRFGHFCTLDYGQSSIRFVHAPSTDDQTKSKAAWNGGVRLQRISNCLSQGNDLSVESSLYREASGMFGPLTVVYNSSSSNTGKALVAIDWQPASEQPGGHPVDAPPTEDCLNIPGLVDCGVIVPEFMGYTQRYVVFKNLFEPMYRVVDKINRWRAIVCKATKAEPSTHLNSPLPSTGTPHTKRRSESSEPAEPGNSLKRH